MLKYFLYTSAFFLVLSAVAYSIAKLKDRQHKKFQQSMTEGTDCLYRKGNYYHKVKIKKLHEFNAVVIDQKTDLWHTVGRIDLYPIDF